MTKLILFLMVCLPQTPQDPASRVQQIAPEVGSAKVQYSILERNGAAQKPANQTGPVEVAQLPAWSRSTVRSAVPSAPNTPAATQMPTAPVELKVYGSDVAHAQELKTFKIRISNHLPTDTHPIELQLGIPPGFKFVDSNIEARYDARQNLASWQLASVPAKRSVEIFYRARATGQGPQLYQAHLIANRSRITTSQHETFILRKDAVATQRPSLAPPSGQPIVPNEMIRGVRLLERNRTASPANRSRPFQR